MLGSVSKHRMMKLQTIAISGLPLLFGMSIGYLLSLGSSIKKTADSMPAFTSAISKSLEFSDSDMAVMIRMFRLSQDGKASHTDEAAVWHLAKFYRERSKLTPEEQEAGGASILLPMIEELRKSNPDLKAAIDEVEKKAAEKE